MTMCKPSFKILSIRQMLFKPDWWVVFSCQLSNTRAVIRLNVKKKGSRDRFLRNAASQTAEPTLIVVTGSKRETLVPDSSIISFHDKPCA